MPHLAPWLATFTVLSACAVDADPSVGVRTEALTSNSDAVAILYARPQPASGGTEWAALIEVEDDYFHEHVSMVYQSEGAAWTARDARFLRQLEDTRELWIVEGLPGGSPLHFAVEDLVAYSGGTGRDFWDNNGGANYRSASDSAAMGHGIDVAVIDAVVAGTPAALDAHVLVRNRAFTKDVAVVWSNDGWNTVRTTAVSYDHGGGGDGGEIWHAHVPTDGASAIDFAVRARQAGGEAWDNNRNQNFRCERAAAPTTTWTCHGAALVDCTEGGCAPYPQ